MQRDTALFGLTLVGTVGGLATLLAGEWIGMDAMVYGGGVVVLIAVGVLTGALASMSEPEGAESH